MELGRCGVCTCLWQLDDGVRLLLQLLCVFELGMLACVAWSCQLMCVAVCVGSFAPPHSRLLQVAVFASFFLQASQIVV